MLWNIKFLFSPKNFPFLSQTFCVSGSVWEQMINACCYFILLLLWWELLIVIYRVKRFFIFAMFRTARKIFGFFGLKNNLLFYLRWFTFPVMQCISLQKECVFVSVDDERQMFFDCVWVSCCCCYYSIALFVLLLYQTKCLMSVFFRYNLCSVSKIRRPALAYTL